MKLTVVIVIALFLSACSQSEAGKTVAASNNTSQAKPTKVIRFTKTYVGAINKLYAIEMTLTRDGSNLSGSYFYTVHKQDIALKGTVDAKDNFTLAEFDASGHQTGTFTGRFVTGEHIEGQWSKPNGQPMPFVLETGAQPIASSFYSY
ncbi:MAG: hypothetical protein DMF64_22090 [Acidobacteria bacterium]|nr:MAG: hypothetical protein DMF64_22090 [Acidobacteriota bacterium]